MHQYEMNLKTLEFQITQEKEIYEKAKSEKLQSGLLIVLIFIILRGESQPATGHIAEQRCRNYPTEDRPYRS